MALTPRSVTILGGKVEHYSYAQNTHTHICPVYLPFGGFAQALPVHQAACVHDTGAQAGGGPSEGS